VPARLRIDLGEASPDVVVDLVAVGLGGARDVRLRDGPPEALGLAALRRVATRRQTALGPDVTPGVTRGERRLLDTAVSVRPRGPRPGQRPRPGPQGAPVGHVAAHRPAAQTPGLDGPSPRAGDALLTPPPSREGCAPDVVGPAHGHLVP